MVHDSIHPTDAEIGQFCRHEMTAEALVAFSDHLAACAACRARAGRARTGAPDLIENLDELVDHVSDEELYAYVHGSMAADRAQSLEGHLAVCASCAAEVRDLASFAAAHAQERRIGLRYAAVAAAVALVAAGAALWLRGGGRPRRLRW